MTFDQLKPNKILRGPVFAEPVEVIVTVPMGDAVKLVGRGVQTGKVVDIILTQDKLNLLETPPDTEPFDGDSKMFRLGIEAMRLALAFEYDPYFSLSIARVDPKMKLLIFTEHKDTLDFLVGNGKEGRLLGKLLEWGLSTTQIHGGMKIGDRDTPGTRICAEREFRESAQVLVATEAAGEGINLQFCWFMINYDIPWNPVWLEQRMGRIHRYGQEKDCLIFNFVSTNTREGRVVESVETENRGFDLISRKLHPEDPKTAIDVRFIEVKGRADTGEIALTANEYNTAKRLKQDFWLYVVFHCATEPSLNILRDPAQLDWQPIVKVEHYRLRQDSLKRPVELKDDSPPYNAGGNP